MQEDLELVVMSTLSRSDHSTRLAKSIKCEVLGDAETATILATNGRVLGYSTPNHTHEIHERYENLIACLHTSPPLMVRDTWESDTLIWETHSQDKIFQLRCTRTEERVREFASVFGRNQLVKFFQFPKRRCLQKHFPSQICGWDGLKLYGAFVSECIYAHLWVLDMEFLIESRPKPLIISPKYLLRICYKPNSYVGLELHFQSDCSSFVYFRNHDSPTLGIIRYNASNQDYSKPKCLPIPKAQFGPFLRAHSNIDLGLKIHINKDMNRLVTVNWNLHWAFTVLKVTLSCTNFDLDNSTSSLVSQLVHTPALSWKFREDLDTCFLGIRNLKTKSIILVEINRNIIENFKKVPYYSSTQVYCLQRSKFSFVQTISHRRESLPMPGSLPLDFGDTVQLQRYYIAEVPNTLWPNKRFAIFRIAYTVD